MIEEIWNRITKGTRLNPYEYQEFPEYHIDGLNADEKKRLRQAWDAHPELWGDPDFEPDWDTLFELAGID